MVFEKYYSFDDNFKRIEINPDTEIQIEKSQSEDYLEKSLETIHNEYGYLYYFQVTPMLSES